MCGALQARHGRTVFDVCDPVRAELSGCALVTCSLDEVLKARVAHAVLDGGRPRAIQRFRVVESLGHDKHSRAAGNGWYVSVAHAVHVRAKWWAWKKPGLHFEQVSKSSVSRS